MGYHCIPLEHQKLKRLTIPNVDENVEQLELSYINGGTGKWYITLENSLAVPYKV